ncbi:hypothetical protein LSAT2_020024 [Lamellibrachia satsuma]|nr:hypothetical protein LSAT2_020024 [Lamellibrachia satsuma]
MMSHSQPVTAALYNPLFKQVVSVAADSTVAVWTMVTGHKAMQFRVQAASSHSESNYIEVTAMCFDPTYRRLITATRLGLVSIWNFNNGACLHEFPTFDKSQITSVMCERSRVICGGWNRRITIYFDNDDDPRNVEWLMPHQADDILDMAFYPPTILASASYDGRIYIWSLSTLNLLYALDTKQRHTATGTMYDYKRRTSELLQANRESRKTKNSRKMTAVARMIDVVTAPGSCKTLRLPKIVQAHHNLKEETDEGKMRKIPTPPSTPSRSPEPSQATSRTSPSLPCSVEKLLFLTKRENTARTATLLSACGDGTIRAWSVHHHGGYMGAWIGVHLPGDMVTAILASPDNKLLFTGDSSGYIKVWDISHYLIGGRSCSDEEHAKRQALWDTFPMMKWVRHIEHIHVPHLDFRSMTADHKPDTPHLLNSFRGHLRVINSVDFFENKYGRWGVCRYSRVLVRQVGRLSLFTCFSTAGGASVVIHAF